MKNIADYSLEEYEAYCKGLSLESLIDIANHIDCNRFPEKYDILKSIIEDKKSTISSEIHDNTWHIVRLKRSRFKPIAYIGLILALISIAGFTFFENSDALIKTLNLLIFLLSMYMIQKGRDEY